MTNQKQHTYLDDHQLAAENLTFDLREQSERLRTDRGDRQRHGIALLKQRGLNVVLTTLAPGAELGAHQARGPVAIHVLDGRVRLHIGDEAHELAAGQLGTVDAEVPHSVLAVEESALLITVAMPQDSSDDR